MDQTYQHISERACQMITHTYSTSFSIGVRCLHQSVRKAIYNIYGFVRCADEIVDTFHHQEQRQLFDEFEQEYVRALKRGVSTNPIIHAFVLTVHKYQISPDLVTSFLKSMRRDLDPRLYSQQDMDEYIYGSAEVVGLMCLKVFVQGDQSAYEHLCPYAMRLGSAFQKVNFLRDLGQDVGELHRLYFPILQHKPLDESSLKLILNDIDQDYNEALIGIKQLPKTGQLGVYVAYRYYKTLTYMIAQTPPQDLLKKRIRVNSLNKVRLFFQAMIEHKLKTYS